MALVNEHFLKLPGSYLFSDIAKKVNTFKITHPKQDIIRLGIGDVTQPLPKACIEAMHKAVEELASKDTFRGYGPEQGYDFLIEAIIKNDFIPRGIHFSASEIFVSDGAKSDTGNIGDILRHDNSVGVTDPIYPVYIDSNVMCGRAGVLEEETGKWSNVTYMPCTSENNFIPEIPDKRIDIVYLCYPNNPTGTTLTKPELKKWVDYALANDTLILFDAAYEAYIQDENVPHSIYEIKGAKKCAIEFRSFSKRQDLPEYAADIPWFRKNSPPPLWKATAYRSTDCGTAASAPSSTVLLTLPNGLQKPFTVQKAKYRLKKQSTII